MQGILRGLGHPSISQSSHDRKRAPKISLPADLQLRLVAFLYQFEVLVSHGHVRIRLDRCYF